MDARGEGEGAGRRRFGTALVAFWGVVGLVYLNQVLFTVYVMRVHHGDASFIGRYLPGGWFDLASGNPVIRGLAAWFPAPGVLAFTVLRAQALLELPVITFAYLAICSWLGPGVYARVVRLRWPAALAWTAMFCAVEWHLRNPYTTDDLAIRVAAGIVVPLVVTRLRGPAPDQSPLGTAGLALFAVSTGALAYVVLVVYDSALLYNLGHLGRELPGALVAVAALAGSRLAARARPGIARWPLLNVRGAGVAGTTGAFGWFLVLFFIPALPIRYGLVEGAAVPAALAGLVIVIAAAGLGARDTLRETGVRLVPWAGEMGVAIALGAAAALAAREVPGPHSETHVLWMASAFLVVTTATCTAFDAAWTRRMATGK